MQYKAMYRIEAIKIREKTKAFNVRTCSPKEVYNVFKFIADRAQESLYIVCLNSHNRIIGYSEIAKGKVNACAMDMRELVRIPILVNAVSVIMLHNHPSGDSKPSKEDTAITQKAKDALSLFGIELLDHIVIGDDSFTSFTETGNLRIKR